MTLRTIKQNQVDMKRHDNLWANRYVSDVGWLLNRIGEVREVLASVNKEWMKPHEFEKSAGLECANAAECDQCDLIQRTLALMEKLEVK